MHPACGQSHSSRVHFLLRSQVGDKSPTSRDFPQKLSVVQTTAGSFCFCTTHNLCKKMYKMPLQNPQQIFIICQSFARNAFFAGQVPPAVLKQCQEPATVQDFKVTVPLRAFLFFLGKC